MGPQLTHSTATHMASEQGRHVREGWGAGRMHAHIPTADESDGRDQQERAQADDDGARILCTHRGRSKRRE